MRVTSQKRMAMPELPEVETIVRTLRPRLSGVSIEGVWSSGLPLRLARPLDLVALKRVCRAGRFANVRRRGKYILLDVECDGRAAGGVLVHLGMSGRLRMAATEDARDKHTHVVWTLPGRRELRYVDPRRFGNVSAGVDVDGLPELAHLGPDPLDALGEEDLAIALARSSASLKTFLLDQRRVAGLGNIYVSEALFRARLHPTMEASRARRHAGTLLTAIKETLNLGIANRGTTLRDYVDADGSAGENLHALLVYGRVGAPCRTCGRPIKRRVDAARSTFFCAYCQRR